jgi:hypothetical protein
MFKYHSISVVGEDAVVVYCCKYDSESNDPVHKADIFGYHNDPTNEEIVNARLQELPAATMKQRGGPKKLCADVSTSACILPSPSFFCNFFKLSITHPPPKTPPGTP